MTEKNKKILYKDFSFVVSIVCTLLMLGFLYLLCFFTPVIGWWFLVQIFGPYLGHYTSYWQFITLPIIAILLFLIFFYSDENSFKD